MKVIPVSLFVRKLLLHVDLVSVLKGLFLSGRHFLFEVQGAVRVYLMFVFGVEELLIRNAGRYRRTPDAFLYLYVHWFRFAVMNGNGSLDGG